MKGLTIFGIIAGVGLLITPAAGFGKESPLPVSVSTDYQFVGYAGPTTGAAGGTLRMSAICKPIYGDQARMCTTMEYITTPNIELTEEDEKAWIIPTIAGFYVREDSGTVLPRMVYAWDQSGADFFMSDERSPEASLTCNQWTIASSGVSGVVANTRLGLIDRVQCGNEIRITCCAPVYNNRERSF